MPRPKPSGTKLYKKYDDWTLELALKEYKRSNSSLAEISMKYNISKSVLQRYKYSFINKHRQALTAEEEEHIVQNLNHCSEWGYPMSGYDLRRFIKFYLDKKRMKTKRFKNNYPGTGFVTDFLGRNGEKMTVCTIQNLKRTTPSVFPEVLETYFVELEKALEGVPLANIISYHELNLTHNPRRRVVVTRRDAQYPEGNPDLSHEATSVMMTASPDGTLLPCYVVYNAKQLRESYVRLGPEGCRYGSNSTGWFCDDTFRDWVHTVVLPYFKNKQGKKFMIGDDLLSYHLTEDLFEECKKVNVYFVYLPANSTHLSQPIDIAFFELTQNIWRDILIQWDQSNHCNSFIVPKRIFPSLLKKMLDLLQDDVKANILTGFMEAGISPMNKNKVLEKVPGNNWRREDRNHEEIPSDSPIVAFLRHMRYSDERNKMESKASQTDADDYEMPGQDAPVAHAHETSE